MRVSNLSNRFLFAGSRMTSNNTDEFLKTISAINSIPNDAIKQQLMAPIFAGFKFNFEDTVKLIKIANVAEQTEELNKILDETNTRLRAVLEESFKKSNYKQATATSPQVSPTIEPAKEVSKPIVYKKQGPPITKAVTPFKIQRITTSRVHSSLFYWMSADDRDYEEMVDTFLREDIYERDLNDLHGFIKVPLATIGGIFGYLGKKGKDRSNEAVRKANNWHGKLLDSYYNPARGVYLYAHYASGVAYIICSEGNEKHIIGCYLAEEYMEGDRRRVIIYYNVQFSFLTAISASGLYEIDLKKDHPKWEKLFNHIVEVESDETLEINKDRVFFDHLNNPEHYDEARGYLGFQIARK